MKYFFYFCSLITVGLGLYTSKFLNVTQGWGSHTASEVSMGIIIVTATTLLTAVFINKKIEQGVALFVGIFWITYVLGFMIFIIEPSASSISISGFISSILYGIGKYGSTFMFAPIFVSLVIKDRTLTRN